MILLALSPIVFYLRIIWGFFQQDEWLGYSQYVLHRGQNIRELLIYFFQPSVGHFTPFTIISVHSLFGLFNLNYLAFAVISLGLHLVTTILVYILFKQLLNNSKMAILGTLLFGLFASSFQGTAWVIADLAGHLSGIFGLLAVIFILRSKLTKSLACLTISLLFKEITIGLFLLIPILIYLFALKSKIKPFFLLLGVYILFRGLMIFAPNQVKDTTVFATQSTPKLIYNFITVPFKSISQSIVPQGQIRWISEVLTKPLGDKIAGAEGSPDREIFVVKRTMEVVSLSLTLLFLFLVFWNRSKLSLFALSWIVFNSLIFSLAPERSGLISTVDSRYLYFVSIGSALLLISLFRDKFRFILVILALINGFWLNKELSAYVERGQTRQEILTQIEAQYPVLPAKTIFYTESDSSFYGLPVEERTLPFQSGLGQTLLAWYFKTERFPRAFFENRYLWDILEQGYKEVDDRGFGYFRDFELMLKIVIDNKLPIDSVIGYRYSSKTNKLIDMTDEIRGRLKGFLSKKRKLDFKRIITISPEVIDGDRLTMWDSKTPYIIPQSFEFGLTRETKITQIDIDSYDNKDQDRVGYSIQLSEDGKSWKQVFYSQKNPPQNGGIVSMPFEPTITRFVRINQLGDHQFASWVIHELSVYEAFN